MEIAHGNGKRAGALVVAPEKRETSSSSTQDRGRGRSGMEVPRVFSTEGANPFDQVEWDQRTAEIKDERGRAIFQQTECEIPAVLEPVGHQRGREQVLLRRCRQRQRLPVGGQARVFRSPVDRPRDADDRRLGPRGRLFRLGR